MPQEIFLVFKCFFDCQPMLVGHIFSKHCFGHFGRRSAVKMCDRKRMSKSRSELSVSGTFFLCSTCCFSKKLNTAAADFFELPERLREGLYLAAHRSAGRVARQSRPAESPGRQSPVKTLHWHRKQFSRQKPHCTMFAEQEESNTQERF